MLFCLSVWFQLSMAQQKKRGSDISETSPRGNKCCYDALGGWITSSGSNAIVFSVSRFLGNNGVHRSVNVMRSWIGLSCVSCDNAPSSYWHVSLYTSWLAITSPSTSITNSSTPRLFAWQRFNEALWEDGERSTRYKSQTSTTVTLWHLHASTKTASCPSSKY